MRRGFRKAEPGDAPGGAKEAMEAEEVDRRGGTEGSGMAEAAVCTPARQAVALFVIASADSVSQSGAAIAPTIETAGESVDESSVV